ILEKPDGYGKRIGDCGDTIEMFLSIRGGQVQMVTFKVEGCANTVACGNTVSYLMEGRTLADGWELTPENVIHYLETLETDHHHCAELAVGAFYNALADFNHRQQEAWKKPYLP
ncbi:MAG: iron-sulfur cluster assembly scaffold protein, partial [Pseudomonadota bacterium]